MLCENKIQSKKHFALVHLLTFNRFVMSLKLSFVIDLGVCTECVVSLVDLKTETKRGANVKTNVKTYS